MADFFNNYIGVIIAGLFALASFIIINYVAQKKAEKSEEVIKKKIDSAIQRSVDSTVLAMETQFKEVLNELQTTSEQNMDAINKEGASIIANLGEKSKMASEIIHQSVLKIAEVTESLRKNIEYDIVMLKVEYTLNPVDKLNTNVAYNQEDVKGFLNNCSNKLTLKVDKNTNSYDQNKTDFYFTRDRTEILRSTSNKFFVDVRSLSENKLNVMCWAVYRFELYDTFKIELDNLVGNGEVIFDLKWYEIYNKNTTKPPFNIQPTKLSLKFKNDSDWREFKILVDTYHILDDGYRVGNKYTFTN